MTATIQKRFQGYAIVYRNNADRLGLDEYLVVEDWQRKSATRWPSLERATIFDAVRAREWLDLFHDGGATHQPGAIVPVYLESRRVLGRDQRDGKEIDIAECLARIIRHKS